MLLHRVHIAIRTVGILAILLLLIVGVLIYFSDEYDLLCDGRKSLERGRAGKPYHCYG